jgi:hypothetical protein
MLCCLPNQLFSTEPLTMTGRRSLPILYAWDTLTLLRLWLLMAAHDDTGCDLDRAEAGRLALLLLLMLLLLLRTAEEGRLWLLLPLCWAPVFATRRVHALKAVGSVGLVG